MNIYEKIITWYSNWHVSFLIHMADVQQKSKVMYDNTVQATGEYGIHMKQNRYKYM